MAMKYFTPEWWSGRGEPSSVALERYEAYFASIRDRLPPAVAELHDAHTLHDSRIANVAFDADERTLVIDAMGWDRAFRHRVRYVLRFVRVRAFDQTLPVRERRDPEWGDLGYYEFERRDDLVEMRILFESGAIFRVEFADFRFEATPAAR